MPVSSKFARKAFVPEAIWLRRKLLHRQNPIDCPSTAQKLFFGEKVAPFLGPLPLNKTVCGPKKGSVFRTPFFNPRSRRTALLSPVVYKNLSGLLVSGLAPTFNCWNMFPSLKFTQVDAPPKSPAPQPQQSVWLGVVLSSVLPGH
jgi:hypothetical protein